MKLLFILSLILSVNGYGSVPEGSMEITVTETEVDILTGEKRMALDGNILCSTPLSVTIRRSEEGVEDEFCCAGVCVPGSQTMTDSLNFPAPEMANWFIHYIPKDNSSVDIDYIFSDGTEIHTLTVHYIYSTEALEQPEAQPKAHKFIRDGLLMIQKGDHIYHL